jgi:hypothetical protein
MPLRATTSPSHPGTCLPPWAPPAAAPAPPAHPPDPPAQVHAAGRPPPPPRGALPRLPGPPSAALRPPALAQRQPWSSAFIGAYGEGALQPRAGVLAQARPLPSVSLCRVRHGAQNGCRDAEGAIQSPRKPGPLPALASAAWEPENRGPNRAWLEEAQEFWGCRAGEVHTPSKAAGKLFALCKALSHVLSMNPPAARHPLHNRLPPSVALSRYGKHARHENLSADCYWLRGWGPGVDHAHCCRCCPPPAGGNLWAQQQPFKVPTAPASTIP